MLTAISIPDPIFAQADAVAERLGVSRAEFYANALAEYAAKFREAEEAPRRKTLTRREAHLLLDESCW